MPHIEEKNGDLDKFSPICAQHKHFETQIKNFMKFHEISPLPARFHEMSPMRGPPDLEVRGMDLISALAGSEIRSAVDI